jgi:hypothetical protein
MSGARPVYRYVWGNVEADIKRNWGPFINRDLTRHPVFSSRPLTIVVKYVTHAKTDSPSTLLMNYQGGGLISSP